MSPWIRSFISPFSPVAIAVKGLLDLQPMLLFLSSWTENFENITQCLISFFFIFCQFLWKFLFCAHLDRDHWIYWSLTRPLIQCVLSHTISQMDLKKKVKYRKKQSPNLIVGTLRVLKKIVWKSFTVEFFYSLAPPGFEPRTSRTLAERATDVATKSERFLAKNFSSSTSHFLLYAVYYQNIFCPKSFNLRSYVSSAFG